MISGERDEEEAAGTDIVPAPDAGLTGSKVDEIRAHLPALIDSGDTDTLLEIATRAEALRLYEKRQGHKEVADQAARLKIESEAAIGLIDLQRASWTAKRHDSLVIGEATINRSTRGLWRKLAIGSKCEMLEPVLDEITADPDRTLTTSRVVAALAAKGAGFTDYAFVVAAVKTAAKEQRTTVKAILEQAGMQRHVLGASRQRALAIETAWRIAASIGLDPKSLPPATYRQKKRLSRPNLRTRRTSVGGEWSRAFQLIRLVEEQVDQLDGSTGNAEMWAALHMVEDLIVARSKGRRALHAQEKKSIRRSLCAVVGSPSCAVLASRSER